MERLLDPPGVAKRAAHRDVVLARLDSADGGPLSEYEAGELPEHRDAESSAAMSLGET
jgi:hypothetical protein